MKNKTESKIIITFKHIDNANRFYQFLEKALEVGDMGGDFYLTYDGAETERKCIGHDVSCKKIEHVIKGQDYE